MRWVAKAIATVGGAGYCPVGPGTIGSLIGCGIGLLTAPPPTAPHPVPIGLVIFLGVAFLAGVLASAHVERLWQQHDPPAVVIDECWAMWAVTAVAPLARTPMLLLVALGLFRVFDILKPPPLKSLARLPGGWGIMLDDVGAASYTLLGLWLLLAVVRRPM